MHHLYPLAKGDPLCPLGFHPQVRWPTRCKRCFRDYKEHGGRRKEDDVPLRRDDTTSSTPSLSWNSRDVDERRRSWVSSSNLAYDNNSGSKKSDQNNPSSWISTPDLANLEDDTQAITTFSIKLPNKRKQKPIDTGQRTVSDSFSITSKPDKSTVFTKGDSLAQRVKKLQAIKESSDRSDDRVKRIQVKEVKTISEEPTNHDVQFLIQVKRKPSREEEYQEPFIENDDDTLSTAGTETTDTTLVDAQDYEYKDELRSLRKELDVTKAKCDKLEREKSDILLRRLAAMETTTSKTTATEVLKLQQKCNELQQTLEDYKDEKRSLSLKVKELEEDLDQRPTAQSAQKAADELRSKLLAAETLCEELMDENEDIKKEMRDMEEQMDEMQDNFREDQAVEYTSLKKELDQTTKNCRILSFKLRKAERKTEQLETEKTEYEKKLKEVSGGQTTLGNLERLKQLEQELKVSNEVSIRLQKELDETNQKLSKIEESSTKKATPKLSAIGKLPSGEGKVSRESLTRGGSQDDPAQLLRDLQDSLEREADLREQLKFAEEEAQNLRKKVSRIEDDNESLVLQLKKMANRARSRKLSPTNNTRLTAQLSSEKGDVSDDEDPAEIKLQLELSEQEASVLRRKIEDLEADNHRIKAKNKDLQDKLTAKATPRRASSGSENGNSIQNQKLKVLEDETNDLRKKLIEKERDCERLHAELSLNQKRSKTVQKSKSLDLDQQTLDLKRQLQVIEQEAAILRSKVQNLESENEKLLIENKKIQLIKGTKNLKSDKNIDKCIDQIASLEVEVSEKDRKIKALEESLEKFNSGGGAKYKRFVNRTPKKISNLTSKDQLKAMVSDLESEIGEMIVAIKTSENEKIKLEEQLKNTKGDETPKETNVSGGKKMEQIQKELLEEKTRNENLNQSIIKTKESLSKANQEKRKLKEDIDKFKEEQKTIEQEKQKLTDEITQLKANLDSIMKKQQELSNVRQNNDELKSDLESKNNEITTLRKEISEKTNLITELTEKTSKITSLEKKVGDTQDKLKKSEKQGKEKIKELEAMIEQEKTNKKSKETEHSSVISKFNSQIEDMNNQILTLETTVESKKKLIEHLENNLKKERETLSKTASKVSEQELTKLKEELRKSKANLSEIESKLDRSQQDHKSLEEKLKKTETEATANLEKRTRESETELQNEKKKAETLKSNYEKEKKKIELELSGLKKKVKTLESSGVGTRKDIELKLLQEKTEKIEADLSKETQKYDDLTAKYEILEEEHVVTKATLVAEKETLKTQLSNTKHDLEEIQIELDTLRETYNSKQDVWIKEKLDMQEKIKDIEKRNGNGNDLEKTKLKATLDEKKSKLDNLKKENEAMNDQMEYMRKENDELRKKLDDYQKVNKAQRNISADSSAMEKEIRQLQAKLNAIEKSKKLDLAECKMRYDNQLSVVNGELQMLQGQVMRFKREKDTYKHMLESAQKTIGDLKNSPKSSKENSNIVVHYDELEESKTKIITLEQQISCMEDELSEARLESSRLKTELVSERSSWEVKMSELHSRVNELEEEKILSSGRTKIVGLRTRMELAWHKEREEQQRLLQETATLARDLRQTLFEVERERDKERLEAKRKQDQFKKSNEEDQDENKKKITELQCDLLELRDAHAKLRTTNEKLRREKERYEKEREEYKMVISANKRRTSTNDDDRKVNVLIEQIDVLKQLAPELFFSSEKEAAYTPTPPRRARSSRSRETSPALEKSGPFLSPEDKQQEIHSLMQRLVSTAENLRRSQQRLDTDDTDSMKRLTRMRRATSSEHETLASDPRNRSKAYNSKAKEGNLHRKSLSLEHTIQNEQRIWKNNDDSMSSLTSIDMTSDVERWSKRDASLDSRLSGDSTQSDYVGEKKKKKGLMGKLKKLAKSRSIDDQDPGTFSVSRSLSSKPNSNTDINEDKGSKKDLKERITGIFKKSGSSSRSNSLERQKSGASSMQRPLMRNSSNGSISQTEQEHASRDKSRKS